MLPGQTIDNMMKKITSEHHLILSLYVIDELIDVAVRKFSDKMESVDKLLSQLPV